MQTNEDIFKHLAITAEVCGADLSREAGLIICEELSKHPLQAVTEALSRVRREHQGRLTLAAILSRLDDGRPSTAQAWAAYPRDESVTVCVTEETLRAGAGLSGLIEQDERQAFFAFRDAYETIVKQNRANGVPVKWTVSLGFDSAGRAPVIQDALAQGKIGAREAQAMLPDLRIPDAVLKALGRG